MKQNIEVLYFLSVTNSNKRNFLFKIQIVLRKSTYKKTKHKIHWPLHCENKWLMYKVFLILFLNFLQWYICTVPEFFFKHLQCTKKRVSLTYSGQSRRHITSVSKTQPLLKFEDRILLSIFLITSYEFCKFRK